MAETKDKKNTQAEDLETLGRMAEDDKWFETLYNRHRMMINRIARSYYIAGGGDVSDLIQEAMIAFYNAAKSYSPAKNASFTTYASVCVQNHLKDIVRKDLGTANAVNRTSVPLNYEGEEDERHVPGAYYPDPVTNFIREETDDSFMDKIRGILSDRQYEALRLYLDGFSYAEIAARQGITAKAVDNALAAAKIKIRRYYSETEDKK